MNRVLIPMFLLGVACLADAAPRPDEPKVPDELQGTWKLVSVETEGTANAPLGGGSPRWVVKGDKILYGGEEVIKLTADASTTPRVIDLKFRDPDRVYEGIYTVEKDKLKVCLNKKTEGAKDRPGMFSTKDQSDWVLLTFDREKAAPANATEGLTAFAGVRLRKGDNDETVIDAPIKDSPADKAGLKRDDIVLKVGATAASDLDATVKAVRAAKPGDKLDFRITRDGKEMTVTVKVGVLPFSLVAGLG
jgi:uncharacterized protein (TIGR03067 family)